MIRFYVMPIEPQFNQMGHATRGPKYLYWGDALVGNLEGLQVPWSMVDYGLIDACVVACEVELAEHQQLASEVDVVAVPENIDGNVSPLALARVKSVLGALRIPAEWVTEEYTYRQVLRMVCGLFQFALAYEGHHAEPLIDSEAHLDLTWNQIPVARQAKILHTANDLGYGYNEVSNDWKVRRILRHLADQWGVRPVTFGSITVL